MEKWFRKNLLYFIGAVLGAAAGYFYWKEVGCNSGTCAISSKPLNSMLYFSLLGALFFGLFKPPRQNSKIAGSDE